MLIPQAIVQQGGGGDVTQISDTLLAVDTASFDVASIPGSYKHLKLILTGRTSHAGQNFDAITMRFNNDSSSIYYRQTFQTFAAGVQPSEEFAISSFNFVTIFPGATSTAGWTSNVEILIPDYASTTFFKNYSANGGGGLDPTSGFVRWTSSTGIWASTSAVTRVTIAPTANDFVAGSRLTVYGLS